MSSLIQFDNVSFAYPNGHVAIEDITLAIEAGEVVAIVGQNGAGKTSLAKVMNGLFKPTTGIVTVAGQDTRAHTTAQIARKVGYVFQNPDDQIFHNDVYSEIEFGPKKLGFSGAELTGLVERAAGLAGISQHLDENPYNLPFATRKFIALASTLAMGCEVFVLDEPTAGQDQAGMEIIGRIISSLKEDGRAVVTITHDMQFVVDNFERVVVMANKQVVADANKREIFWNLPVLDEANLKQPYLSQLSRDLGLAGNVLELTEFVGHFGQASAAARA
jgi:energy-coupling factor transport system ATP-binding protein